MTNRKRLLLWGVAVVVPAALSACSSDDPGAGVGGSYGMVGTGSGGGAGGGAAGNAPDASVSDSSSDVSADSARDSAAEGEAGVASAFARVAHLSPDAPAVDFCLRAQSSDAGAADAATDASDAADGSDGAPAGGFTIGPVLKGLGVPTGLSYTQVTGYVTLQPRVYDVRIVAANAADCSTPLAGLPDTSLPLLVGGTYSTIAAIGLVTADAGPAFQLKPYLDERAVTTGKAKLRFIHASPGTPNVDVGLATAESFMAVFTDVPYSAVGGGTGVDALGYVETSPLSSQTLAVRATGTTVDSLAIPGLSLAAGAVASSFAIGIVSSATTPLKTLICQDLDTSKAPLANCSVLPAP
ncbi:MAG TPA: DUF4397 domain-containing protein [Polyangiaceae bacterium]|nr:DUF4397 domain-containing protein [Polyangiaceae bacterium]